MGWRSRVWKSPSISGADGRTASQHKHLPDLLDRRRELPEMQGRDGRGEGFIENLGRKPDRVAVYRPRTTFVSSLLSSSSYTFFALAVSPSASNRRPRINATRGEPEKRRSSTVSCSCTSAWTRSASPARLTYRSDLYTPQVQRSHRKLLADRPFWHEQCSDNVNRRATHLGLPRFCS